jgi:hypothetical protein
VLVTAGALGLWDLSGYYATTVKSDSLSMALVHDSAGELSGTATYTLADRTALTMPIRGRVRGSSGNTAAKCILKGTEPAGLVSVSLTLDLAVETTTRQLVGQMSGTTTPVKEDLILAIPGSMDGTWELQFELDQEGRNVTGTALLVLPNAVEHAFLVSGKAEANDTAALTLTGAPADPAAKAIGIRTTITTPEAGWARIEKVSVQGYGQTLGR